MTALAIPLLRRAALVSIPDVHPYVSRMTSMGTRLLMRIAALRDDPYFVGPWCDRTGGCYYFPFCPSNLCDGASCSPGSCTRAYVGCESGGTCWTVRDTYQHCCDCACTYGGNSFYCICFA